MPDVLVRMNGRDIEQVGSVVVAEIEAARLDGVRVVFAEALPPSASHGEIVVEAADFPRATRVAGIAAAALLGRGFGVYPLGDRMVLRDLDDALPAYVSGTARIGVYSPTGLEGG